MFSYYDALVFFRIRDNVREGAGHLVDSAVVLGPQQGSEGAHPAHLNKRVLSHTQLFIKSCSF